jgi:hypothetical protein
MTAWAELLKAIAALLWPGVAFAVLALYHREIRRLLTRIRKGKFLGQEVELTESLDELRRAATAAEIEVPALPPAPEATPTEAPPADAVGSVPDRVLQLAASSPKAALLLLASELERALTRLLANLGLLGGRDFVSFTEGIAMLRKRGLPPNLGNSVELFYNLRNRLVHGRNVSDDDVLRAIDSGTSIFRALEAIPHEVNYVHHPGVPVYSDRACTQEVKGVRGVILRTHSPDADTVSLRIYPSTRSHFQKGRMVAWEWSHEHRFGEAWYRDPETGDCKPAWSASLEFVGRNIDEL